ncbi:phosphatidylserine decarboxylase [Desulfohalotomaculum tongense]|uniref:phosphatidylserine decarboxylase family protein n=1 Tax=Desulforadius tongensis TaxID=1216062 RepID=UPI0019564947|nr:phosphatidylserine decarboxylase family protein [Desulforadius tongensis]MBM7855311.1 phosphatidylserine decarboxylase [Desulforadius tongensis]
MSKKVYPIAQDGWLYLAVLAALGVIFYLINPYLSVIPAVLFLFVAFFFRNPKRRIPQGENIVTSPADGVILSINEVQENKYIKGKALRVSIFLSIFNVHLNRAPVAGKVEYRSYRPGKFLPAFKGHASELNEKSYIGINTGRWKVMVTQVTGFIARRIVCWANVGDKLGRGELFGLIKFGSCTELYLPVETELLVKEKDKVRGGETVIGRLPDEQ